MYGKFFTWKNGPLFGLLGWKGRQFLRQITLCIGKECHYANFNPERPRSVLELAWTQSSSCSFQVQKNWASLRTRLSPHIVENWSLTIEIATDDKRCVKYVQQKFEQ